MRILGIESSCDETAAAVVEDGQRLLSNVVHSQIDIHAEYGGVIPEVAARSHIEVVNPVIQRALDEAGCSWDDIDAIAVTFAPGLIGSLLVGNLAARTLAILHDKPIYAIHHVEGHIYANFITEQGSSSGEISSVLARAQDKNALVETRHDELAIGSLRSAELAAAQTSSNEQEPAASSSGLTQTSHFHSVLDLPTAQPHFPMLALAVSGKHSELLYFRGHGDFDLLGETQDDAIGEAFDKVAKIIGLPYPGGPAISQLALEGDRRRYDLPIAKLANPYDFSFSGLKTATLRAVQRETGVDFRFPSFELAQRLSERQKADFAASFEYTAVKTLVNATKRAFQQYSPTSVVIAGGVAANQELRRQLSAALPIDIEYAPMQLCTDNAAMIAALGYYYAQAKQPNDPYDMEVVPSLTLDGASWAKA